MADEQHDYLGLHANGLFTFDQRQRISGINQFDGGVPPRFYLARSSRRCFCFIGQTVEDSIARELVALVANEPRVKTAQPLPPVYDEQYRRLLVVDRQTPSQQGPVFFVPAQAAMPRTEALPAQAAMPRTVALPAQAAMPRTEALDNDSVVLMTADNAGLLEKYLPDWIPDVAHRSPFWAAIDEGHAVAVCASVRMTSQSHEAGVETHPAFRRRGHAVRVVCAWANSIYGLGAIPVYSTDWVNTASRAVAKGLNLEFVGVDYSLL